MEWQECQIPISSILYKHYQQQTILFQKSHDKQSLPPNDEIDYQRIPQYTLSTHLMRRIQEKFPLAPIGVLAPGSAHA